MPLITLTINMECSCSVRHSHPLCKEIRFGLFLWWHENHHFDVSITAITLGVSRRTVFRWLRRGDVDLHTATMLDQLRHGLILGYRSSRARPGWRELLPDGQNRQMPLFGPTGCARCQGAGCSQCYAPGRIENRKWRRDHPPRKRR